MWEDIIERTHNTKTLSVQSDGPASFERLQLSHECTQALIRECNRTWNTQSQELLLVALGRALHGLTGNQAFPVTMEGHGREFMDPAVDVSSTVGWFTTMYPLIIGHDEDLGRSIQIIRHNVRKIPNRGIGCGSMYGYIEPRLPQVSFNFLGHLSQSRLIGTSWQSEHSMNGDYGLCQSLGAAAANKAALDMTAWVADDQLHVELCSRLTSGDTRDLLSRLEDAFDEIIECCSNLPTAALADEVCERLTSAETSFIPCFEFTEAPRNGPILFLLPPGEGGAESYFNNIVKEMPDTRLMVFNNYHLRHPERNTSFESLAGRYIAWMRERQSQGPFHIASWSFGGVLSLEICRQLTLANQEVATLALIDPYFNVRKACADIGLPNETDILDPINYHYQPDPEVLRKMAKNVGRLVLFKAPLMNERTRSADQVRLFEYYMRSKRNALDTLVDFEDIQLVELFGHAHFSWVHNKTQVQNLCGTLLGCLGL